MLDGSVARSGAATNVPPGLRARSGRADRPHGRGHGGACARLRRHLPPRTRAPVGTGRAGGAAARRRARRIGQVLEAFPAGFQAMAGLTAANHPRRRAPGWHPTAVGGVTGAATAAARLLGLDAEAHGPRAPPGTAPGGRPARGIRVRRQGPPGRPGRRRRGPRRPASRPPAPSRVVTWSAATADSTGLRRRWVGPAIRGRARAGRARELDQGVSLLPADARRDRGGRPSADRRRPGRRRTSW